MKILININIFLFIVYICIIIHNTHSFSISDSEPSREETKIEPYLNDDTPSLIRQHGSIENAYPAKMHALINQRRADSAEKYFDWASKTNRPMEYLRGKRFWLFTRKDEHGPHHEATSAVGASPHSLSQGIWRSGIVGRRRR